MKPIIKFQSTHPRRVWHNFYFLLSLCTCFNPHTHAGCDSGRRAMRDAGSGFNPHTHAGCDYYQCFDLHIRMFQSTHPRRVWPWSIFYNTRVIGFNPHTHAGCDSFHLRSSQRPRMFQSTHPRRVWHTSGFRKGWFQCFNPHTHAGCDIEDGTNRFLCFVSIHTPTQGVTGWKYWRMCCRLFQSTHPRRVWRYGRNLIRIGRFVSIHTPTQGVTEGSSKVIIMDSSFNPHTHAGCDHGRAGGGVLPGMVSIHTPTQGVTISAQAFNKAAIVSIHTPTQGVTGRAIRLHPNKTVSIHTPTQGVTNGIFAFMGRRDVSIHTPTQGVTSYLLRIFFT